MNKVSNMKINNNYFNNKQHKSYTIAERNRIMWPELKDEPTDHKLVIDWVNESLKDSKPILVDYKHSSKGVWETERNDEVFSPSKEAYSRLLEKVKSR